MVKLTMACLTGIGYDVLGQVETTSSYQYPPPSSYRIRRVFIHESAISIAVSRGIRDSSGLELCFKVPTLWPASS
ncbi:hypothetical protein FPOAC1_005084 [Fusarium poae]|uniref:hypothetical protein n=1 Tax=Fusarium poae TaxID=36050 RepID=UPI001CE71A45|nr:hypothetical protein FPOAC1_005084 [Fusarium poae]KAG8671826.1 hypothetical protein FPOAC1_005084 [Fusarium poae]